MRHAAILAIAATLVSTSLAAQTTSCLSRNWPAGNSINTWGGNGDFAIPVNTGASARTICGLQFKMRAFSSAIATRFMIWSRSGNQPATLLRSASVTIGTTYAVYGVTFPALTLAANTSFFVGYRSAPNKSRYVPIVTSGSSVNWFFRFANTSTWSANGPLRWSYNVLCCGGGTGTYGFYGMGCKGTGGSGGSAVPLLTNTALPNIDKNFALRVSSAKPSSPVVFWYGGSRTRWGSVALPLNLAFLGAPTCSLYASYDTPILEMSDGSGVANTSVKIPLNPAFVGVMFYNQAYVADAGANAGGLALTRAGVGKVGR